MATPQPTRDEFTARYCVVKHSWKGKYTRIFCIGRNCLATINPNSIFKITNLWDYSQVIDVTPVPKTPADILVSVRIKGKEDTSTFTCQSAIERAELLTDVQSYRSKFDSQFDNYISRNVYPARKYRANEEYRSVQLFVSNVGVHQRDQTTGLTVGTYHFMHIKSMGVIADNPNGFVILYGRHKKLHLYQLDGVPDLMRKINEMAAKFVGLPPIPELEPLAQHQFDMNRLGVDREKLASTAEFPVMKLTARYPDMPIRRIFATTETCILERDPTTYNAVSAYHLKDVYALIRCEDDAQKFKIEYKDPHIIKTYTSPVRDALLAHLVESCRSIGNANVSVLTCNIDRGKRAAPCRSVVAEEIESTLLKCLIEPAKGGAPNMQFHEFVEFFNANVEYSGLRFTENRDGLFAENREKLIFGALMALLDNFPETDDPHIIIQQFYALRRLCVTRIGFSSAAIVPTLVKGVGRVSVHALRMHHTAVSHAVIDFLCTLMTPHHDNFEPYHEQVNKNRMLSSESFVRHLLGLLKSHIESDSGALVIHGLLDFFVYAVCPPYSEMTDEACFNNLISLIVDSIGKSIFLLFNHNCKAIRLSAGMIVRVIMEEGGEDHFFTMQRAALSEGGFLRQFYTATFGPTANSADREMRDLARVLTSYWTFENQTAQDLLRRMLPITMLHFLQSKELPPEEERIKERQLGVKEMTQEFRDSKTGWFKKRFHPKDIVEGQTNEAEIVITRPREVTIKPELNWTMFFYQIKNDHARPDLIWNHNTRQELKEAIEAEQAAFQLGLELRKERAVCWNYQEFDIQYASLQDELRIGNHYPRLLFESANPVVARPKEFFNDLYHRFLLVQDFNMKNQCLQGMALLYKHYAEEIGVFNDIEFMVQMLEHATHPTFRDRMLIFISMLLRARLNVKPFIDCNGVRPLVDLLVLAHLHIDRPQLHSSTNAIESSASPLDLQDQEKEWHYTNKDGEKMEPVSYAKLRKLYEEGVVTLTTKVWAQGLGGWKDFKDVQQIKWGIIAHGKPSVMTLSEVACTILDIFMLLCAYYPSRDPDGSVMQPLPRVKRFLSDPSILPHIVQLLLTFDPPICSRVHHLLFMLMEDNPLMPRFFLTGAFFFTLMYTASDVLPLCRLLSLTHRRQSFQTNHDNEIIRTSVLTPLLPPAMVCYLTNHGPEKFAQVFLGEFETPEAIWGKDMRRYLVQKIAAHIADFTPRLLGNVRAQYQYCPIVGVEYEPLKNELFCSQYYLRHLCDDVKYPTWPVADPVALMKDVLAAWKLELEREPCKLNRESCLEELEIKEPSPTPQQIRKAYFKLAAIYHPDKNPTGREKFEAIQEAYEFLASDKVVAAGPDSMRISLLLRTQSILFSRYGDVMCKYKYAGYGLLLKLVAMEFEDEQMLNKEVCLMDPAVELCYHTVNNAPINADELLQEGGFALMEKVMMRCAELVMPNSRDTEHHVRIVRNCVKTFHVAASFDDCLKQIMEQPFLAHFAAKGIAFEKAPLLARACIHCAESFCAFEELQRRVTEAGAIWHLLLYVFRYDYTLEDSGVVINEENHTQLFANRAAKAALRAIYALAGYRPSEEYLPTVPNRTLHGLLMHLLTPFIVKKMKNNAGGEGEILRLLNSNHETPYFLWNNISRSELRDFLARNSEICRDAGPHTELPPLSCEGFEYSAHSKELIIDGVFVRVYNLQPQFAIEEPMSFFQAMIDFVQKALIDAEVGGDSEALKRTGMIMEAMQNLIIAYPDVHNIASAYMHVILQCLHVPDAPTTNAVFSLLAKCCAYPSCIESVGNIKTAISDVIIALERGDMVHKNGLLFVHQIMTDRQCVQQLLDRGLYVILILIFATSRKQDAREEACVCLAKACSDKLNGPKVMLRASKIIPAVFLETMKENPPQVCQMFETWQENPELVWNAETKARTVEMCSRCKASILEALDADRDTYWKIPEELTMNERPEDVQVGGVYLELFMKQPNWSVRRPREFLIAILEKFVEVAGDSHRNPEVLELVTTAAASFLQGQPTMTDYIVALGYIQKIFKVCESTDVAVSQSAVRIAHEIANSRACVESMTGFDPISSLLRTLDAALDDVGVIMDTLERLMTRSSEKANMIKLAVANKLPQKLLSMLETGMVGSAQPAAARAIVVKVLKSMLKVSDPLYGPQVEAILNESATWRKYKDQSHELFLTNTTFGGFLTGPKSQPVLSLAAPPSMRDESEPPPLD